MKLTKIKPNEENPRFITDEKFNQLVESIREFPEMLKLRPIVVDENMVTLGGNMRLKACKAAGLTDVPVTIAKGLSEEQKREFIIKDNVGYGQWDWDILGTNWQSEQLSSWGLDVVDFDIGSSPGIPDEGNFDDEGILPKNKFGVIVMCESEAEQSEVFMRLSDEGLICKVAVV